MKKQYICLFFACLTFLLTGCDKYLDIQPTGSVIPHTLAEYRALWLNACTTVPADRGLAGMGADEMFVSNKNDQDKYGAIERWEGTTTSTTTVSFDWANYYEVLFFANFIIEHHDEINEGSQNEIAQLTGEAYAFHIGKSAWTALYQTGSSGYKIHPFETGYRSGKTAVPQYS